MLPPLAKVDIHRAMSPRLEAIIRDEANAVSWTVDAKTLMTPRAGGKMYTAIRWRIWERMRNLINPMTLEPLSYPYIASLWSGDHTSILYACRMRAQGREPWPGRTIPPGSEVVEIEDWAAAASRHKLVA